MGILCCHASFFCILNITCYSYSYWSNRWAIIIVSMNVLLLLSSCPDFLWVCSSLHDRRGVEICATCFTLDSPDSLDVHGWLFLVGGIDSDSDDNGWLFIVLACITEGRIECPSVYYTNIWKTFYFQIASTIIVTGSTD